MYERAGDLYESAGRDYVSKAAKAFFKASRPLRALNVLLRARYYIEIIEGLDR